MVHLEQLSKSKPLAFLSLHSAKMKAFQLFMAFVINFLLLTTFKVTAPRGTTLNYAYEEGYFFGGAADVDYDDENIRLVVQICMAVLTCFALLIFISMSVTFGPLAIKNAWAQRWLELGKPTTEEELPAIGTVAYLLRMGPEAAGVYDGSCTQGAMLVYHIFSSCYLLSNTVVLIHLMYLLCAICGNLVSPFFICIHMLDLVYTSEMLKNVLRAVTFNGEGLLMTSMLTLLLIWIYSIIAFTMIRQNYINDDLQGEKLCETLLDCFMVTTREGLIHGGGMGEWFQPRTLGGGDHFASYMGRFFFDLSFFILIIIVLLNIIFGIIIDTFSALREATETAAADMKTVCTMCGLERADLDRKGSGFDEHIKLEHNMWKYLAYVVYIDQKDQNDYTGLESYVSEMIEEEDMNFYPLDKALCMEEEEEEVDPFRLELDERQIQLQEDAQMMNKSLADLRDDNTTNHENTMVLVKQELDLLKSIFDEIEVRKLR